jgi:hypothetical protein
MRDNITGEYMPYSDMLASAQAHNVPCIKAKTFGGFPFLLLALSVVCYRYP